MVEVIIHHSSHVQHGALDEREPVSVGAELLTAGEWAARADLRDATGTILTDALVSVRVSLAPPRA